MAHQIPEGRLADVVSRVPELAGASTVAIDKIEGGLTNDVYLINADGERFVARTVGENGPLLVPDRTREQASLRRAAAAGITPQVMYFDSIEGHLVTRFVEGGAPLSESSFRSDQTVERVVGKLKQVHSLEPTDGYFDPYDDIRRWLTVVDGRDIERPTRLRPLLGFVAQTERQRMPLRKGDAVLCHNDPFHLNFLDDSDGKLWLIDWEYSGMGDRMYDIASVGYTLDDAGRDLLLKSYFGEVNSALRAELRALMQVVLCWNVVWSLIQIDGGVSGFDYLGFAEGLLDISDDLR